VIVVSRHEGAVQWLRELGYNEPVYDEVSEEQVRDKEVVGNIPLHLAALATSVLAIEFEGRPPRGKDYSADDMRKAGARLVRYKVIRVNEKLCMACIGLGINQKQELCRKCHGRGRV
jgi:hypothetical protein